MEYGPKDQALNHPTHPYTEALLEALPVLGEKRPWLLTIQGDPLNADNLPTGCPFHPRCDKAMDQCSEGGPTPIFTTTGKSAKDAVLGRLSESGDSGDSSKLPNAHRAMVEREKIAEYLLATVNPPDPSKPDFFGRLASAQTIGRLLP